jgi:hypothetical protein
MCWKYCKTASTSWLSLLSCPFLLFFEILGLLIRIGGCYCNLSHFTFVLNSTIVLSRSFRSWFLYFTLINVNFWAINFSAMNLRILQRHYLTILRPQRSLLWFCWCFCCVQKNRFCFCCLNLTWFEILRSHRLWRILRNSSISLKQRCFLHLINLSKPRIRLLLFKVWNGLFKVNVFCKE